MSSNVGLSTPRGSGTSGFVQRNRAFQKPRDYGAPYPSDAVRQHQQRQPDKGIMEHEAKREIEIKVLELQDKLEDEAELNEEEIEDRCDELRKKLLSERKRRGASPKRTFKSHEVHGMADAKIKESERLRNALKISRDYQEGDHWRRQEERVVGGPVDDGERKADGADN